MKGRDYMHMYPQTAYDRSWKGTTEEFVLHFHEQFRQLDELTPLDEQLPHSVRLTHIQTAVRSVPELRIVETMEEYTSLTYSYSCHYSMTYDKYFTMLKNACIRYDKSLKQKPSSTARAVYQHELDGDSGTDGDDGDYVEEGFAADGIDTPSDDFYNINTTNFNRNPPIEFWCFTFNSSLSRCSIGYFNVCLYVSLINVTLKVED